MSEADYKGVLRSKIPWDPIIDQTKCTVCGKCIEFCHMQAFKTETINGKKQTTVNPNRCVVFCFGCEDVCPAGAISHPDEEQTQRTIDKLKRTQS
jgi:formate hydrogenlyase subunit 6/NADH:ubiquinone oxidoreductase subunit I